MDSCGSVVETTDSGICSKTAGLCLLSHVLEIIEDCPVDDKIDTEEHETFFDSQAWLRSDSEDEFFSLEPQPLEEKKELVELLQDPFWSDLLIQHHKKQLVQLFEDWSWTSKQSFMDHSKHLEPSITVKIPKGFNGLDNNRYKSRKNSMDGNERAQKDKSKSKEKSQIDTCCCIPMTWGPKPRQRYLPL